jgi:hypothetical protein
MIFPEDYLKGKPPKDYSSFIPIVIVLLLLILCILDKTL